MITRLKSCLGLLLLMLLWEIAPRVGLVRMDILPPLSRIFIAWLGLASSGELWTHGVISLFRAFSGAAIAIVVGTVLGVAMAASAPVRIFFRPLMEALYPIPKSALIPITALWLGLGNASQITLIALGCILPVAVGAYNGARGCERVLIWSGRALGAGKMRTLVDIVVPSALPELLSGIRTALALCLVLLVSSELIVSKNGLGYLIGFLGGSGIYDAMFAAVLTIAIFGLIVDRLFLRYIRWVLSWQ
ncbi:ABC transporter permease [Pseudaminobacter soli (ex Li et al. 2025)]|uniref:ABC transmembrane type-1 domain-containing protein n=1 Tax=Pseudaminobacter soli (ex Li et al. 2025) TaxID=1295366 RepID=A0A2P7S318_9HYPH|nr:ABC transporter permease [Mesorhizobium soli]PSJ56877.1 hypothetical protein C7I85_23625 [Mesorhizobium soli]